MAASESQPEVVARSSRAAGGVRYTGEVVYIYAFDFAYDMPRLVLPRLLGQPVVQFSVDASRRSPKQLFFYRPQMVRLPPLERFGPHGPVPVERTVKLLPVGAISITVSVPFQAGSIRELVPYHDLKFGEVSLQDEVRKLAEEVHQELARHCSRPVPRLADEEAYTVFCLASPPPGADPWTGTEAWLEEHRLEVAGLLTQEEDLHHLSRQEAEESTARFLSYYRDDLVVVDWDAALILDEPGKFHETLYAMELANLQLAELEAYDRLLDEALDRAYRDLGQRPARRRGDVLRELREIRIDMARFSDELSNITKFFGDWHLARVYESIATRFHLGEWHRTIDEKLKTLDELYQLLQHDQTNRWMLILESTIVLLFIIDLVILLLGAKG